MPTTEATLTALDRCDGCGAQAYVETALGLLFCAHHAREAGTRAGAIVRDETYRLTNAV